MQLKNKNCVVAIKWFKNILFLYSITHFVLMLVFQQKSNIKTKHDNINLKIIDSLLWNSF